MRLSDLLSSGPAVLFMDHANDANTVQDKASLEALIRRVWAANPATRIILVESPSWITKNINIDANVEDPTTETQINNMLALAAHYGIEVAEYWQWCRAVVNAGTYHLNELTADTVHPTTLGYTNMAALVNAFLPYGGTAQPIPLPARLYDNGEYENTPTRVMGNTGTEAGTGWGNVGVAGRQSSTAGDTIVFTATCQSYGVYRADEGTATAEVDIDGGGFSSVSLIKNGIAIAAGRGEHTITIRVLAGQTARIDEFWAI